MKLMKYAALGVIAMSALSTAASADVTRAAVAMPATSKLVTTPASIRGARRTGAQNNLIGAPVMVAFLGAVAVTVTTVVVTNNNDSSGG